MPHRVRVSAVTECIMSLPIAKEGIREIALATAVLVPATAVTWALVWPLAIVPVALWVWVLLFFRDPERFGSFQPGDLCAPADGTVTEITELDFFEPLGGPAVKIGIFLSLFNAHINRAPCAGRVRSVSYKAGEFLDARHPESGSRNEANTLLIDADEPMPGPVQVRQVAGLVARRIICHAKEGDDLTMGERFGMIKFGSRTELVIPRLETTVVKVALGDKVRAGETVIARQLVAPLPGAVDAPIDTVGLPTDAVGLPTDAVGLPDAQA